MARQLLKHKAVRRSAIGLGGVAFLVLLGLGLIVGWLNWRYRPPTAAVDTARLREEVAALRLLHDTLRTTLVDAQNESDLLDRRPSGDIVIALPTPFVSGVVTDVVTGWFDEVDIHLRNIRLQKSGTVRTRLGFLGRRTVGDYTVRLHLLDVQGRLKPEAPVLTFGGDSIGVEMPVRLVGGIGHGRLALDWDSRGLARPICGDLEAEHAIDGTVMPQRYMARGRLHLSASEGGILADPMFPGLAMRLLVRPSAASVRAMEELLQSKGPLCDIATAKGNVEAKIMELVGRGFLVRIPQKFFRAVRLPISVQEELPMLDRQIAITATPDTLIITKQAVWLSANISVRRVPRTPE